MDTRRTIAVVAFATFAGMVVLSNYLLVHFGLITVTPWGWQAPAGVWCVGVSFVARDVLQRYAGIAAGALAVLVGATLAWTIAPTLAVASGVAYLASESTDLATYTVTRRFVGYSVAIGASVVAAAFVDSAVFLSIAGIPWDAAGPGLVFGKIACLVLAYPLILWLRTVAPVDRSLELVPV